MDEEANEDGDVILHPPNDGQQSDEESGDDEIINPGHMTRGQLTAEAEMQNGSIRVDDYVPVSDTSIRHIIFLFFIRTV